MLVVLTWNANELQLKPPQQSLPRGRRSVRLSSPQSLPQAEDAVDTRTSQSRRRASLSKPSSIPVPRFSSAAAVTPSTSQPSRSASASAGKPAATPNNVSRHATPPRPLVAETAYFRRTLTPIARKALKGKAVGCMEKPIDFEGEDPLLLEPELRHRSGSMTPGSITRSKRIPKTAPTGKRSRTKVRAPPATSAAQRLFVRPDDIEPVASSTAPEDDSDDEAGNDTFVDVKTRRQPHQGSALGSHPPLNASDLKSSDVGVKAAATPKRPSPLLDLGRFVGQSSPTGGSEPWQGSAEDDDQEQAWNEPLFLPGSPDSSLGSPPPMRSPSAVPVVTEVESEGSTRSETPVPSVAVPSPSSSDQLPPPASLRSSPALHAPTPTLAAPSPARPLLSSPAIFPSPVFPVSPALRAPTPGNTEPSPQKFRENLRKSVQTRSRSGKRLSESVRSPSREQSRAPSERPDHRSASRLQSPFDGAPLAATSVAGNSTDVAAIQEGVGAGEEEFDLEGDTVIAADQEEDPQLEETFLNTEDLGPVSAVETVAVHQSSLEQTPSSLSEGRTSAIPPSSGSSQLSRKEGSAPASGRNDVVNGDEVAAKGSETVQSSSPGQQQANGTHPASTRKRRPSGRVLEVVIEERLERRGMGLNPKDDTAEDPALIDLSSSRAEVSEAKKSWLDRSQARSATPASPLSQKGAAGRTSALAPLLSQKRQNKPQSSLDRFLASSPDAEPPHVKPSPSPKTIRSEAAVPYNGRLRAPSSPGRTKRTQLQEGLKSQHALPSRFSASNATHASDLKPKDTVEMPVLDTADDADLNLPQAEYASSNSGADASFSNNANDDAEANVGSGIEYEVPEAQVEDGKPQTQGADTSFDLSAETVDNGEESFDVSLTAHTEDEDQNTRSQDSGDLASDRRGRSKLSSHSPYISDDLPLADVVNAAIGAGMVIEGSSATDEAVEDARLKTSVQASPRSPPQAKESSPDLESEEEPVMPPRLRRSLHAGATPRRPSMPPAKVVPTIQSQSPSSRSHVSETAVRSPASVRPASSLPSSSPVLRDHSSPFLVKRPGSPVDSATTSSGGRSSRTPRTHPEIVVEPSSPPGPNGDSTPDVASGNEAYPIPRRRSVTPTPSRVGTASLSRQLGALSAEANDRSRGPSRHSGTPTPPARAGKVTVPVQKAVPGLRTDQAALAAPSPRVIKPLPSREASVTPRQSSPQNTARTELDVHSYPSSRATSRSRSRSPYRSFSPKAIGTTTAIAATALAAAVPAAASPSPATVQAQVSPEPAAQYVASAVASPARSPHRHLDARSYRSPPRSRSSRLSATPSAYSSRSERSRSPYVPASGSEHISLANSRLALALAALSDDEEDDFPPPPTISFTPLFQRSQEEVSRGEARSRSPSVSVSRQRTPFHPSVANSAQAIPKSTTELSASAPEELVKPSPAHKEPEHEEAIEIYDIGADDTVVHDVDADETVDAGNAWDLTAAEFTFDAEMTAFESHAFKGVDWDATRIERVARGRSEDHQLQVIDEQSEEDIDERPEGGTTTYPGGGAHRTQAAKPAEKSRTRCPPPARRQKTPTPAPASPVRSSPRLAAKKSRLTPASPPRVASEGGNAETAVGSTAEKVSNAPVDSIEGEADPAEHRDAAEPNARPADSGSEIVGSETAAPGSNHKVTLKVVTRVVKRESGSEVPSRTQVSPKAAEESPTSPSPPSPTPAPQTSARGDTAQQPALSTTPARPPPPPPPPMQSPVTVPPRFAADTTANVRSSSRVNNEPIVRSTSMSSRSPPRATLPEPPNSSEQPATTTASNIAPRRTATANLTPLAVATQHEPRDERPRSPEHSDIKAQTSFVKKQSHEIERALGRRPVVPSKLSKEVVPSSSPAESPAAESSFVETASPTRSPTRPSAAYQRRLGDASSSFATGSSSSRFKRRFEEQSEDADAERYAPRASLHEELTAASDSDSEFDPEFPSMVAVSSADPRAAARAAAILKMHHNWIENGILPDGSRVGTPRPHDRSRARSVGSLESPRSTANHSSRAAHHSRFFDSMESSRLISKEELLHEAELELVGPKSRPGTPYAADSPFRPIPGAWATTPHPRTPKRKRDSDEHVATPRHGGPQHAILETPFELRSRSNSRSYDGDASGRPWTKRDWRFLEKTFKILKAKTSGSEVDSEAVVCAFLKQTGKEPVGEWSREVLLLRVNALARRAQGEGAEAGDREAKRQKTSTHQAAPPSTLRKVMGWLWPATSKSQTSAPPTEDTDTNSASPNSEGGFMRVRDETFDIGEVTMAATPSRRRDHVAQTMERRRSEDVHHAERSFDVDLERGNQSYDIPYDEEEDYDDGNEYFLEPATYTARGERSSVTEASTSMYDHNTSTSSTRRIYPNLPDLHFPSRPHSLASSTKYVRKDEPRRTGAPLPVLGTPRPRARVRSDSSIADTSIASRPGSVRDMIRGFEESQELDLSFESARREREKNELLGLRRVRSVVEKVKEQHQI